MFLFWGGKVSLSSRPRLSGLYDFMLGGPSVVLLCCRLCHIFCWIPTYFYSSWEARYGEDSELYYTLILPVPQFHHTSTTCFHVLRRLHHPTYPFSLSSVKSRQHGASRPKVMDSFQVLLLVVAATRVAVLGVTQTCATARNAPWPPMQRSQGYGAKANQQGPDDILAMLSSYSHLREIAT